MENNILETLRDSMLTGYKIYNKGFANVTKPDGTDVIEGEGEYRGIEDSNGNYFYLRSLKESTFEPVGRGCKVLSYSRETKCRAVSFIRKTDDDSHEMLLVTAISRAGHSVDKVVSDKVKVFYEETGTRNVNNQLEKVSLLYCDFTVTEIISAKNCKQINCYC